MDVSLDTDITIHLFESSNEGLLFKYFNKIYIHEFVLDRELIHKSDATYKKVNALISAGKIEKVNQRYLIEIGMKKDFEEKRDEIKILFDYGEANAVALAAVLGIAALVTDDTKEYGPHDSLIKEYVENIIPFAFYELLYLEYLQSEDDFDAFYMNFETINHIAYPSRPMNFLNRIKRVVRRFSKNGTARDRKWITDFCAAKSIDYPAKMRLLKGHLETQQS